MMVFKKLFGNKFRIIVDYSGAYSTENTKIIFFVMHVFKIFNKKKKHGTKYYSVAFTTPKDYF